MESHIRQFGLIGYPLGHSFSKGHFTSKFEREGLEGFSYENFEIESAGEVRGIISSHPNLVGLNVTIPHKKAVMPFLDEIDPVAREIGAVNTIKVIRTGDRSRLHGYNTDATGFTRSLAGWKLYPSVRALIFGNGGSSLAVKYALDQAGIRYTQVSRNPAGPELDYGSITEEVAMGHLLWINCTPVGMFPDISRMLPLPYQFLTSSHYLYDLVYNPEVTEFLRMGKLAGAFTRNGRAMLYEQAEASWEIWIRKSP
jgi:shikimate dehydrogenase